VEKCKSSNRGKRISPGQQQLPFAFDIRLNQIPDDWHQIAVRFRLVVVSVMAIKSEVFGGCVEAINVGVESRSNKKLSFAVLWGIRWLSVVDGGAIEGG
jgi:hypothetical protein